MLSPDAVIETVLKTLERLPRLQARTDERTVKRSITSAWPDPPAPLILYLFIAGSDLAAAAAAEQVLGSVDAVIAVLEQTDVVWGAWRSRLKRVLPPSTGGAYADHYVNFQSALYELMLAFRLLVPKARVKMNGELAATICDLEVERSETRLASVEAFAPRKWADQDAGQVTALWKARVFREPPAGALHQSRARDIGIDPEAVARAISEVLTTSNFDQKRRQLDSGDLPTLLAIRAYGLTRRPEELAAVGPPLTIAGRISREAWDRLPERCLGILLSFVPDVLKVNGRPSPVALIPAPGRVLTPELWSYLDLLEMLANDVLAARDRLVSHR